MVWLRECQRGYRVFEIKDMNGSDRLGPINDVREAFGVPGINE